MCIILFYIVANRAQNYEKSGAKQKEFFLFFAQTGIFCHNDAKVG
jgi:hypothetical protein